MPSAPFTIRFDSRVHESFARFLFKNLLDLRVYRFAILNFVVTNLRMRYRRSFLGFLWSLLNPLMVMTVISLVFSIVFKQDLRSFSLFIFSGLAPWNFINQAIQGGAQSLVEAEGFLKKVYLPKLIFPIISVTTELINFAFSLVSLYALALFLGSPITWRLLLVPLVMVVTYFFVLGVVVTLSVAVVYFRDLQQIIMVLFTALFYSVPILYPLEQIPDRYHIFFKLNPLYHYIMLFRKVIFGQPAIEFMDWVYPISFAVISCMVGLFILMKKDRDLIYRL